MINTLLIGDYIYDSLKDLEGDVVTKIAPIVVSNDTDFPFITYQRNSLSSNSCKDGYYEDTTSVNITIVATTYDQSRSIAQEVRKRLERRNVRFDDYLVDEVTIINASESYNNAYVQTITFQFAISK